MKLIEICDFQGGSQPPKEEWSFEEKEGYIRMLQIRDFTQSDRVIPEYIKISNNTKICEANDILIARYGASIGKILTGLAGAYNVALMRTIPDTRKIKKKYLYYYLKSPYFQNAILNVGSRAAQAGFNKEDLSKLDIECPKLSEQENIVSILDKVEIIIEKRREELAFLDDLIKARFVEMFGDPVTSLKGRKQVPFSEFMTDIKYGTSQPPQFSEDGEYKFIRATNIKKGRITEENMLRISEAEAAKIQKCKLLGNEIIIVRSGANTGDTCVVTTEYAENYAGYDIIITLDLTKANPVYFNELINTHYMEQIVKPLTARSAQPHLNTKQVQGMPMIVASMDEQNEFAVFVEQVHKSKLMFQKLHQKLNILQQKAGDI